MSVQNKVVADQMNDNHEDDLLNEKFDNDEINEALIYRLLHTKQI